MPVSIQTYIQSQLPSGAQGAQGIQGAQGALGAQGAQGAQGVQGLRGAQGAQGVQGAQGSVGQQGAQGAIGAQGAQGATGIGTQGNVPFTVGSFGVGTAASGVQGEIRATNNITAYYVSDKRLKENIRRIQNALELIKALDGVRYDWTDDYIKTHGGEDGYFIRKQDVGLIAQDLQKVLPEIVIERSDGYLAVKYERVVALLLEAIKELDAKVDTLIAKKSDW